MVRLCDELLGKRDPEGYYVILAKLEALPLLEGFDVRVEQNPSLLVVRVKSRSMARKICRILQARDLLVHP
ncbi:MAG: hypothetical protein QXU69_03910 [Thermofilaceae archaeon]